jgi:hypothetical protein
MMNEQQLEDLCIVETHDVVQAQLHKYGYSHALREQVVALVKMTENVAL